MELVARIAAVGKDDGDRREAAQSIGDHGGRSISILNVRAMNLGAEQIALCIDGDMALASLDLLACMVACHARHSRSS